LGDCLQMIYRLISNDVTIETDEVIQGIASSNQLRRLTVLRFIIFINCKWVDTQWQWSIYILHMHGL
jgi:hypothetical protein